MFSRNTVPTFRSVVMMVAMIAAAAVAGAADGPDVQERNPYTIYGHQVRTNLIPRSDVVRAASSLGPTLFQEIVPCRFISTLEKDHYPQIWGGPEFERDEARSYVPKGTLVYGDFTNPCSDKVPFNAVAVSLRLSTNVPKGDGVLWLAPGTMSPFAGEAAIEFKTDVVAFKEANVVLLDERFVLASEKARTHVTADIIGYFIPDEYRGERGEKGERGEQGLQGERGAQGEAGPMGPQGPQGLKGDTGAQGERGFQGERGEKGDPGAAGANGKDGSDGRDGKDGRDGAMGPMGAMGPQGPMGPMGPMGPQGQQGPAGTCNLQIFTGSGVFPPPGQIRINDSRLHGDSIIILQYVEISNGNALAVADQGEGWMVLSGSPNKPYGYVVINR